MASALFEELRCSICLSIFSDPVTLSCGHSFCRGCITAVPEARCPQCQALLPSTADLHLLLTSLTLQSLAERAKERQQQKHRPGTAEELCPEHEERMKLFCVTDQKLACIICRDGESHHGHLFKPIREAAAALRRDIDLELVQVEGQMEEIQNLTQMQRAEVQKAKQKSESVRNQVQRDFQAMQQFLRRREDEILNGLRVQQEDVLENMNQSLNAMNQALSECRELKTSLTQVMEVSDPEMFLRRWSEEYGATAEELERTEGLAVVQSPLFQGPYQSHLQFFIWKEMLQMVEPKAKLLTLRDDNSLITVSEDGASFQCAPQNVQQVHQKSHRHSRKKISFAPMPSPIFGAVSNSPINHTSSPSSGQAGGLSLGSSQSPVVAEVPQFLDVSSSSGFSSGQQYWEVEVRLRDFWCVGVTGYFLKYKDKKYFVCEDDKSTEVTVSRRVLKVGVYLNCSSKTLSFYDADSMERLEKVHCEGLSLPTCAFFRVQQIEQDKNPLTVCRY